MLLGTIDLYDFLPLSVSWTLAGCHKVSAKQDLLASFSCAHFNRSGWNLIDVKAEAVKLSTLILLDELLQFESFPFQRHFWVTFWQWREINAVLLTAAKYCVGVHWAFMNWFCSNLVWYYRTVHFDTVLSDLGQGHRDVRKENFGTSNWCIWVSYESM